MARRDLHLLLGLTALTLGLVAVQALTGAEVLLASPALVLALPLLAGRYVGEERIVGMAVRRLCAAARPARRLVARLGRAPSVLAPRGGRLIAASLAERGPPAAVVAAR